MAAVNAIKVALFFAAFAFFDGRLKLLAWAWETCPSGGVCPDHNTCCPSKANSSFCITAKKRDHKTGSCCSDGDGKTGCGPGYRCVTSKERNDATIYQCENTAGGVPQRVPRYRLCSLPAEALKETHSLNVYHGGLLVYYSNMGSLDDHSDDTSFSKVRVALIMIHGSGRNADDYLCCATASIPREYESVLVIAPRFLAAGDVQDDLMSRSRDEGLKVLKWNESYPIAHTWRYGADAVNTTISSYAALDALVEHLAFDKSKFPLLKRIIVAGHSAGGQMTQRWALTSYSPAWHIRPTLFRVVVANPRSFCYLDGRRYNNNNNAFELPNKNAVAACPGYNKWEWGLDPQGRLKTPYKDLALQKVGGKQRLVERYRSRDVVYLAGALDTLPVHSECEDDDFQGSTRFERSKRFHDSLLTIYGPNSVHHERVIVPHVPHDHCLMFQSVEGQHALFGNRTGLALERRW